ncbi:hypothetical protein AB0O18_10350 [Streptomyces sp. NPDC093224]|uniref:hypothetical protein n=1 Tax=Streptomyces sp. NPDC093224 TaxID=3155198 RepID=UPI0034316A89
MIRGFRPSHWPACAVLAAAALAPAASAYAGSLTPVTAHRSGPPASAPYAARAGGAGHDGGDLAGSAAGAGRERPGRPVGEPADPELVIASRPLPVRPRTEPTPPPPTVAAPVPTPTEEGTSLGTAPNDRAADLAAHILPLGTGFALMGLGLGYMGVRLRRGA